MCLAPSGQGWLSERVGGSGVLLLAAVVCGHHQVAVGTQVLDVGGLVGDGGGLALHAGDLEHAARVVLQQVALERLPASPHTNHHMLVMQHLRDTQTWTVRHRHRNQ